MESPDTPQTPDAARTPDTAPVWQTADPSRRLTDVAAGPQQTTLTAAQSETNFLVFDPTWLPEDCTVESITVRPEQPPGRPDDVTADEIGQTPHSDGNPSSVRVVVTGADRQFRLKQFLYDWAPSASGIAPLWRTPDPEPFACGDAVGWLGTDYKDNRGACVQRRRTQLELSVTDGTFEDAELRQFLSGLEPVSTPTARLVTRTPFHRLNYWHRFRCRPPAVPHGLWDYAPAHPYETSFEISRVGLGEFSADDPTPLVPADDRYEFDSAVQFGTDAVEIVFRHTANASDHLWLLATTAESDLAPPASLAGSDQSGETREVIQSRDTSVHFGALSAEFGGWEAIWSESDAARGVATNYAVWAGPSLELDSEGFRAVVDSLRGFE